MSKQKDSVVIEREAGSNTTNLSLHPLAVMTISDHYTRVKVVSKSKKANPRVIGALLGVQKGRDVEIFNSFPLPYEDKKKRRNCI